MFNVLLPLAVLTGGFVLTGCQKEEASVPPPPPISAVGKTSQQATNRRIEAVRNNPNLTPAQKEAAIKQFQSETAK